MIATGKRSGVTVILDRLALAEEVMEKSGPHLDWQCADHRGTVKDLCRHSFWQAWMMMGNERRVAAVRERRTMRAAEGVRLKLLASS